MSAPFRIGLLGHGTVGAAFAQLREARVVVRRETYEDLTTRDV